MLPCSPKPSIEAMMRSRLDPLDPQRPLSGRHPGVTGDAADVAEPTRLPGLDSRPAALAERELRNVSPDRSASVGLDAGRPDHLTPLLGFIGDEFPEVGGRTRKYRASLVGKPRLELGIGEPSVDRPVEPADDLGGRVLRRTDATPEARLVVRHEITHGREVRQRVRARRGGYRQRM